MRRPRQAFTRRTWLGSLLAAPLAHAQSRKGATFPSDGRRYSDPTTEFDVIRLTDPAFSSTLSAFYNRDIARSTGSLLFCCDRSGSPQAFRMDLKNGQTRQLTDAEGLDGLSLTMTPDNRAFSYFAGRAFFSTSFSLPHDRELYHIPEGWERCPGMSIGPDGTHAVFAEQKGETCRLRMVSLAQGVARTVVESPSPCRTRKPARCARNCSIAKARKRSGW